MSVICQCPSCKAKYQLGDQYAGHKIKCPKCSAVVEVPATARPATTAVAAVGKSNPVPKPVMPVPAADDSANAAFGDREAALAQAGDDAFGFLKEGSAMRRRPPAGAAVGGESLSDAAASSDVLARSGIGRRASEADRSPLRKKKKRSAAGWVIAAAVGGVALVAVIAVAAFLKFSNAGGSTATDAKKPASRAADPNVPMLTFTFKWPASERRQATLTVNGDPQDVPPGGDDFKIKLPKVAKPYHFVLERKGFKPKEFTRPLTEDDDYLVGQWESDSVKGVADWGQDFVAAKKLAADQHKNVLIVFDASDANASKFHSSRFNESVASSPEFVERANKDYVCVYIDNPEHDAAKAKVRDAAQNKKVTGDFEITVFPTVVVTDPRGRPFGVMDDYTLNGVSAFLAQMTKWEADGKTLFDLLEKSKESSDAVLNATTLDFLELNKLDRFYAKTAKRLAANVPPEREATEHDAEWWVARFRQAMINPDNVKKEVEEFDRWKTRHSFKRHADAGAGLETFAGMLLFRIGDKGAAKKKCDEALALQPTDPDVLNGIEILRDALEDNDPTKEHLFAVGSGSGFCIASGNYIMTNHHVIRDAKKIMVHLNDSTKKYLAHLVADNPDGDMAVLKVDLPEDKKLVPIPFAAKDVEIGDEVCAFGWPGMLSRNRKSTLTNGLVSGMDDREGFLVTNCKIEHGNSGGPLCSVSGCCIAGMVTAKTATAGEINESYGLAIPASKLIKFLESNKDKIPPDFSIPPRSSTTGTKLPEVVKRVQASAVYVENYQPLRSQL